MKDCLISFNAFYSALESFSCFTSSVTAEITFSLAGFCVFNDSTGYDLEGLTYGTYEF